MAGYSNLRGPRFERPPFPELENRVKHSVLALFCVLTIRLESKLMAVAAFAATHTDMKILTFDVTGAFLQCTWTGEQLYVRLPDDTPTDIRYMGETHLAGRVVEVRKAWYGLKESNHIFGNDLKATMDTAGYEPTNADSQIYVPRRKDSEASLVGMHVDDAVYFVISETNKHNIFSPP